MDLLATPSRRKVLFGLLYLSEGAPIGFIWLGLPTRWRAMEIPVDQITWLMALLIMPWTLKFLWAPLIDLLRGPRWGFRHWILTSQSLMAMALLPLLWLDVRVQFSAVAACLLFHAFAAATQDISIDALCVNESQPIERGSLNGWMQCGVMVGRAAMGGGSLILERYIGFDGVVAVLIALIMVSALALTKAKEKSMDNAAAFSMEADRASRSAFFKRLRTLGSELFTAIRTGGMGRAFLFALIAPAAFKSLEAVLGPLLIDHGYSEFAVGQFTATTMIAAMIVGSLFAGRISRHFQGTRFVAIALIINLVAIVSLAVVDRWLGEQKGFHVLVLLTAVAFTIGWLTVALYHWLMNLTSPKLAATEFTAFMAATNACEAWSTSLLGSLQVRLGYPAAILVLCAISAAAIVLLVPAKKQPA
ncbi:MFS transporter [Novipirellula sp.]|uniref:MFS transporter n=1 Tax=Novipirellula sp. TaxID=2795430 RepID=UPI0035680326